MINWKEVKLNLMGDIRFFGPCSALQQYNSATPHHPWSCVEGINVWNGDYYPLPMAEEMNGVVGQYRQHHPDWSTYKEWLRMYFNEVECHELDPQKYPVYQTIIGILLEGGSVDQVHGDLWLEAMEAAPNSFRERTLLDLLEEIDYHQFPCEQTNV